MKLTKSHVGEEEKRRAVYICTHTYHVLNGSEVERALHARAGVVVRPVWSWSWWRASGLIKIFILDQVKLNVLLFNSRKNDMHFYLKRQVVCLENKNVMHFILSNFKRDKRVLGNKFSKLNFP